MRSVIRKGLVLVAAAGVMLACAGLVMAQTRSGTTPVKKTILYIVIKVTNTKGDVNYDALQLDQLPERQKQLPKEFETALAAWTKAKADAEKNKKKFEDKKPVQGKIERVETDPPAFKTPDLAKVEADKRNQKLLDAKKAAAEKPATTTTSKPAAHTPPSGQVVKPADDKGDAGKDAPPPPPDNTKGTGN